MSECSTYILSFSVILDKDGNEQRGQNALAYFPREINFYKKVFFHRSLKLVDKFRNFNLSESFLQSHDIQQNDAQQNDTQQNK